MHYFVKFILPSYSPERTAGSWLSIWLCSSLLRRWHWTSLGGHSTSGDDTLCSYTGLYISPWNMLENWLMPQLNDDSNDYIFQQDVSPAHYKAVRGYLNRNLPQRWLGLTGKKMTR